MEKEVRRFLEAEEAANEVLVALKALYAEVESYKTAKDQLDAVRNRLAEFIDSTERLLIKSHEIVGILKEIGGPEILDMLKKIEIKMIDGQEVIHSIINNESEKIEKKLKKMEKLIYVPLISSIIAVILGIILLLK